MTQAWRMVARTHGGPEVIAREEFDPGLPGEGELLIAQDAVGLNFIDTYFRSGLYPAPLPTPIGAEGAGHVAAVGPGVTGFAVGDKVGCAVGLGAYATHRMVRADQTVRIPDAVTTQDAAAMMLKGMTACYLAEDIVTLDAGQFALVHAAAGGVGSVLVPWLRDKGVLVIAHCGSAEKAAKVDAEHSLYGSFDSLAFAVREITGGRGVDVVYDGVGKDSWSASLASLKRRGLMVSYGNASGAVPPISLLELSRGGSLYVTRPTLFDYIATPEELARTAERLFDRMARGVVRTVVGQRFALADAADAHRALEARQTTGSTLLIP
ncbi:MULTISPECIES: quinone oxidoreductase family protein [Sphingobium]|uniref:Quinone oxidoreductase n=1 Tax=Sphingobium fuliginis (strain ATCC 27551) TaxID=336203 RepID=A0ABQ1FAI3_SPHSA|nr:MULTISPECIES: quinone oxidoreductase [Sphingobium]WDA34660.1 quinone oxidoreductase [Sphingobium sp. YC-XJ3]GGA04415.1 quinone oxidoreductase [Sphingobium fuliginis]